MEDYIAAGSENKQLRVAGAIKLRLVPQGAVAKIAVIQSHYGTDTARENQTNSNPRLDRQHRQANARRHQS